MQYEGMFLLHDATLIARTVHKVDVQLAFFFYVYSQTRFNNKNN
jgi:hypothetical protein